jgi:hypothetical protein
MRSGQIYNICIPIDWTTIQDAMNIGMTVEWTNRIVACLMSGQVDSVY